jgi:hypothetical protein
VVFVGGGGAVVVCVVVCVWPPPDVEGVLGLVTGAVVDGVLMGGGVVVTTVVRVLTCVTVLTPAPVPPVPAALVFDVGGG